MAKEAVRNSLSLDGEGRGEGESDRYFTPAEVFYKEIFSLCALRLRCVINLVTSNFSSLQSLSLNRRRDGYQQSEMGFGTQAVRFGNIADDHVTGFCRHGRITFA